MEEQIKMGKYGTSFTMRFNKESYLLFTRVAKEDKISRSLLMRRALNLYYEKREALKEIELIKKADTDKLPFLITSIKTDDGRKALQERLIKNL